MEFQLLRAWRSVLAAALLIVPMVASAQQARPGRNVAPSQPAAPATPASESPDRTTSQYGDWTLRCEINRGGRNAPDRSCEIVQTLLDPRGQPVAQIVIGRLVRTEPWRMLLQLPLELRVDQPARVFSEATDGDPLGLPFRVCSAARGGCFADLELRDDTILMRLRAKSDGQGRIEFNDAAGRLVQAIFSFRGFGAALDALIREG